MSVLRSLPSSCQALSDGLHHTSLNADNQGPQQETGRGGGGGEGRIKNIKI